MDDDWDLHAVVRGCAAVSTTTTTSISPSIDNPFPSFPSLPIQDDPISFDFPSQSEGSSRKDPLEGFQEIYRELCVDAPPPTTTSAVTIPAAHVYQPFQEIAQIQPPFKMNIHSQESTHFMSPNFGSSSHNFPAANSPPARPRRRKNQQTKMVRQMTQEELSADSWAWRKYGQKPIKGSAYPRNYYRCSTSKGCAARKQVERSPNDPGIFVVSYTGEHTHPRPAHRSSLAGSTRSKFSSPTPAAAGKNSSSNNALLLRKGSVSSSPVSGSACSPTTPLGAGDAAGQNDDVEVAEEEVGGGGGDEDDENVVLIPNEDEDVFKDLQDSDHSGGGGDLVSHGLMSSPPWTPTGSAAGGGSGG